MTESVPNCNKHCQTTSPEVVGMEDGTSRDQLSVNPMSTLLLFMLTLLNTTVKYK